MSSANPSGGYEGGQALVEFGLTSALALMLILGIFDVGRMFFAYDFVAQAARIGTRYAIVNAAPCASTGITTPCEQATAAYIDSKLPGIDPSKLALVFTWQSAPPCAGIAKPGCSVAIQVDYAFSFVALPLPGETLQSSSQIVISQ